MSRGEREGERERESEAKQEKKMTSFKGYTKTQKVITLIRSKYTKYTVLVHSVYICTQSNRYLGRVSWAFF